MSEENITEKPKRGRPPKKNKTEKKSYEVDYKPSEFLVKEKKVEKQNFSERTNSLNFAKVKELLLQDVRKNGSSKSINSYNRELVRDYLLNPEKYCSQIRALSQYLYRSNTLYKKLVLYYACMPLYNYNVLEDIDLTKPYNFNKTKNEYFTVIKNLHQINFRNAFSQMVALSLINGVYFGYIYDQDNGGKFFHYLNPDYCKIRGKNSNGKFVVAFDVKYFSIGYNSEFVEGVKLANGTYDTKGCWDDVFVKGWKYYNENGRNAEDRWIILPPEKTMCLPANLDDDIESLLPFWLGLFDLLLLCKNVEDAINDKAELENFKILVSKIPLLDDNRVDDLGLSLELVQSIQSLIDEVLPDQVGSFYSPMETDLLSFGDKNNTEDVDMLSETIHNVFNNAGASELVVASGGSTSSTALKYSIKNDESTTFMWLSRLEVEFNYVIHKTMNENYSLRFHEQTWYDRDEYSETQKTSATLGASPLAYLTSLNQTPYEVWTSLVFSAESGIRDMMIPLQSSYNMSKEDRKAGRPKNADGTLTDEGEKTAEGEKNLTTKISKES